jgi:hypothetical protein
LNGRYYVGVHSTNNLDDGYLGSGNAIKLAVDKYGKENFIKEILHSCEDRQSALEKEKEIVNEEFVRNPQTYNLKGGGESGFVYNDEWVAIVSERAKKNHWKNINSPEAMIKRKEANRRRAAEGEYSTPERCEKIRQTILTQSEEISKRVSADWADPEHKEWRSQQMRGVKKKMQYCPHCGKGMRANLNRHIKSKHFELME